MLSLSVINPEVPQLRSRRRSFVILIAALVLMTLAATAWVGVRGLQARSSLAAAAPQVERLTTQLLAGDRAGAETTLTALRSSTQQARGRTSDPVWRAAGHLPWVGANLSAVATVAASLDDLADTVLPLIVGSAGALDASTLAPVDGQFDLASIERLAPGLTRATAAIEPLDARLAAISTDDLVAAVAGPVAEAQGKVHNLASMLQAAHTAATLLPAMLGADGPRSYLLMLQTNAELRATGGMPGALSVLSADDGRVTLTSQSSAGAVYRSGAGPIALTAQDEALFSDRMGIYMADVNFTPDFPVAADLAAQLWLQYCGEHLDGVIATDPVALSYLLAATGPVDDGVGGQLSATDAVDMLLSGAYARFPEPADQDTYFATVAANVFTALVDGRARVDVAVPALARAAAEHRLLVWSAGAEEQDVLAGTSLSGSMNGGSMNGGSMNGGSMLGGAVLGGAVPGGEVPGGAMTDGASVGVAAGALVDTPSSSVGVFFNDGTGSKMDYYLNTSVSLAPDCSGDTADGSAVRTVRVSLANDAPADAAQTLSESVTGTGSYGAARGQIETSVVIVGPVGGAITGVSRGGLPVGVSAHDQSGRPATVLAILLAPGEDAALVITMRDPAGAAQVSLWSTPTKDQAGFTTTAVCT